MLRKLAALAALAAALIAAPPLVTIQDVIYKANGSPFNGVLLVEWKSFEAHDTSFIGMHSVTVPVVNGVMRVQLVATTTANPPAYYQVRYNSDGNVQFDEYWAVPASSTPLRLKDIRIAAPLNIGSVVAPPPVETGIQETDVIGLIDDLAARPLKGPGYAPSRAAAIAPDGTIEAVAGSLEDCVRVDGTAGPCGAPASTGPGFVDAETPAGVVDGVNAAFTLSQTPTPPESVTVHRNGVLQRQALDYSLVGNALAFVGAALPQPGDVLVTSYRIADAGNPTGHAGGALTGQYPSPSLVAGGIADPHVSDAAAIRESKLALNFATHSSINDPAAGEKAAMAGTYGTASAWNRYVTDQDPRMANARTPAVHGLLASAHSDTAAAAPVRGDLVVAQGSSPSQWTRLPVGPAGRCLVSNGSDAVWNTCLYSGFTAGSVPFADASGSLAQNATRFVWDNANRKLSIGNNVGAATLYVYDAQPATGATELTVRAGQGQASDPLQRWLSAAGAEVGRVEADGRIQAGAFRSASTSTRAAWQDAGSSSDPTAASGDVWFNATAQAHKAAHMGQAHPISQVICSSTGGSTSATALSRLGSCTVPANLLKTGDRVELRFDYFHSGTATGFVAEVRWGGTTVTSRSAAAGETLLTGRADAAVHSGGAQWSAQSWGTTLALTASAGNAGDALGSPLTIDLLGRLATASADSVSLRNFTVLRYPAQHNP
ncbi:MAG TPA: hypothetical protein VN428_13860 [Bryobacteraceae bacterium]|nr:hypothetical protein [Bryobacteraceae bacterium]